MISATDKYEDAVRRYRSEVNANGDDKPHKTDEKYDKLMELSKKFADDAYYLISVAELDGNFAAHMQFAKKVDESYEELRKNEAEG